MSTLGSTPSSVKRRRRHTLKFKKEVVNASKQPGRSVADVAQAYQVNNNLLHKWRRELEPNVKTPAGFIQLSPVQPQNPPTQPSQPALISLELPSSKGAIIVRWPADQHDQMAAWLRLVMA